VWASKWGSFAAEQVMMHTSSGSHQLNGYNACMQLKTGKQRANNATSKIQ
jgi:hypothetical protein